MIGSPIHAWLMHAFWASVFLTKQIQQKLAETASKVEGKIKDRMRIFKYIIYMHVRKFNS